MGQPSIPTICTSGETIHHGASKTKFSAVGSIHDSHTWCFGSVRSHGQPGGCILLSFIKTNTKSDLICIGRSTKSASLRLISDNTGVYLLTYMQNRSFTNQHFSTKSQYLRKMASILISTNPSYIDFICDSCPQLCFF